MRKLGRMIGWAAIGSLASMTLSACAAQHVSSAPPAPPAAVAVKDVVPSAELLLCPALAPAIPTDMPATIPPAVRMALIGLAMAYATNTNQLERLLEWLRPGGCPPVTEVRPAK